MLHFTVSSRILIVVDIHKLRKFAYYFWNRNNRTVNVVTKQAFLRYVTLLNLFATHIIYLSF